MPDISVVVPVYNTEKYLRRCVESILRQSFADFELILIDDGSTDGSGKICDEYAENDKRVKVIHQENGGLSAARNTGIEYAVKNSDSEWITFIDSDDLVSGKLLEKLQKAARDADTDISAAGFLRFTDTDGITETDCGAEVLTPEEFFTRYHVEATIAWGKLYKVKLFSGIRYPVGKLHEDEFVTYRLLFSIPRIAFIEAPLYYYFQNSDGIMLGEWNIRRTDQIEALSEQVAYFRKNGFTEAEKTAARTLFIGCVQSLNKLTDGYPEQKHLINSLRRKLRKTMRRYSLDVALAGGEKNYFRLAHPNIEKLRIKAKHAVIGLKSTIKRKG